MAAALIDHPNGHVARDRTAAETTRDRIGGRQTGEALLRLAVDTGGTGHDVGAASDARRRVAHDGLRVDDGRARHGRAGERDRRGVIKRVPNPVMVTNVPPETEPVAGSTATDSYAKPPASRATSPLTRASTAGNRGVQGLRGVGRRVTASAAAARRQCH